MRLMVVDDEPALREIVSRALSDRFQHIDRAEDGADALAQLDEANGEFDLLLSDVQMPLMDGIDLVKATASRWPALPIVLMTGYAHQRENARELRALIKDVIPKPFSIGELRNRIDAAITIGSP